MVRWAWLLGLALVGCDPNGDGHPLPEDGCPEGLQRTTQAGLTMPFLNVDGLDYFLGLDVHATYDGVPAACVSPDGTAMQLIFADGSGPMGRLVVQATAPGAFSLDDPTHTFRLEIFGIAEPITVQNGPGVWQSGTWEIRDVGLVLEIDASGTASFSGRTLSVTLAAEARP